MNSTGVGYFIQEIVPLLLTQKSQSTVIFFITDCGMLFRIERRSFSDKESEQFTHYCRVVVQDFLPHLVNCFNALFPPQSVNELASCSPYVLHCNSKALSSNQQSSLHATAGRRGVQFTLEFDLQKLIEPLKVMLPDLFANDLYNADSLTQDTTLLHNDITNDDVTGTVGDVPVDGKESDTTHDNDDVILNNMGETPVISSDTHDLSQNNQEELTGNNKETLSDSTTKETLTGNDLPAFSTDLQQDTTLI